MEESPWESFIERMQTISGSSTYDMLCKMAVDTYGLDAKSGKAVLKDKVQFLCLWWDKHKKFMKVYKSLTDLGKLLNKDHATVLHSIKHRKPSWNYDENTKCLKDFLES